MTMRRQRREDPAYLTAMREAKELFDAEMAKNSMKGRGRPKTIVTASPAAAAVEVEIDHGTSDEIADLAGDEVETEELDTEEEEVAPAKASKPAVHHAAKPAVKPVAKAATKPATTSAKSRAKSSAKFSSTAATRAVAKRPAKKKAAPAKGPAPRKR
jgi:hypothetical protein